MKEIEQQLFSRLVSNLTRLRKAHKMTIEQVAEAGGLKRRHVERIEAGEANVNMATLAKLANAFGIDVPELLAPRRRARRDSARRETR